MVSVSFTSTNQDWSTVAAAQPLPSVSIIALILRSQSATLVKSTETSYWAIDACARQMTVNAATSTRFRGCAVSLDFGCWVRLRYTSDH